MRHRARSILAVGALLIGGASIAPIAQAQDENPDAPGPEQVKVFRAEVTKKQIPLLLAAGQDGHELGEQAPARGTATVEVYLTDKQAEKLQDQGVRLTEHELSAKSERRVEAAAEGVFRPYSCSGATTARRAAKSRSASAHSSTTRAASGTSRAPTSTPPTTERTNGSNPSSGLSTPASNMPRSYRGGRTLTPGPERPRSPETPLHTSFPETYSSCPSCLRRGAGVRCERRGSQDLTAPQTRPDAVPGSGVRGGPL